VNLNLAIFYENKVSSFCLNEDELKLGKCVITLSQTLDIN